MRMNMLYDSDNFVVVQIDENAGPDQPEPAEVRSGYEIVDKRTNKCLYLYAHFADIFTAHIREWQERTPQQEEVEETLDGFASVMTLPLCMH